jgi:hypothetical protein
MLWLHHLRVYMFSDLIVKLLGVLGDLHIAVLCIQRYRALAVRARQCLPNMPETAPYPRAARIAEEIEAPIF